MCSTQLFAQSVVEKYYHFAVKQFESNGLYYIITDTVPYFRRMYDGDTYRIEEDLGDLQFKWDLLPSVGTYFTDGEAWVIPPFYADQLYSWDIKDRPGLRNYDGDLVIPNEVIYNDTVYRVGLSPYFAAQMNGTLGSQYDYPGRITSICIGDSVHSEFYRYWRFLVIRNYYDNSIKRLHLGKYIAPTRFEDYERSSYIPLLDRLTSLEYISVSEDNPRLFSDNGILYEYINDEKTKAVALFVPYNIGKVINFSSDKSVTGIGHDALNKYLYFTDLKKFDRVNIPENISYFESCLMHLDVDTLCVFSKTPPKIMNYSSEYAKDLVVEEPFIDGLLMVPDGALELYASDAFWSLFYRIEEMGSGKSIVTGTETITKDKLKKGESGYYDLSGYKYSVPMGHIFIKDGKKYLKK